MGIFGWDLPPGCSVSDIPGNRPEDMKWEAMIEDFYDTKRIRKLKYGIKPTGKEIRAMSAIYRAKKYDKIESAVDTYIAMAIEYGMDIGHQEAKENQAECDYYEKEHDRYERNPKLIAFFKAQRKLIKDLQKEK